LADSSDEDENQTQGNTPQNRKRAYNQGEPSKAGSLGLIIKPKTKV